MNNEAFPALLLLSLLDSDDRVRHLNRLGPALYLAQRALGRRLYFYRLSSGHVVSDELTEEIAQLTSAGLVEWPDADHIRPSKPAREPSNPMALEQVQAFQKALECFVVEEPAALDAVATRMYFSDEGIGDPATRLAWFRTLPSHIAARAGQLAEELQRGESAVFPEASRLRK